MHYRIGQIGVTVLFLFYLACAPTTSYRSGIPAQKINKPDIQQWAAELKRNPDNPVLVSDIAAYFFETGQFNKFSVLIKRAYKLDPTYPQTLYYMGRAYEHVKKYSNALRVYAKYTELSGGNDYKRLMEGRYRIVTRLQMHETMRLMLENEALLDIPKTAPSTIAVLPLEHLGSSEEYASMGKGLAEMIMTDLNQVKGLKTVERLRVQALIDEMQLGQTGLIQEGQSAKYGKLLGAGKLVTGNFSVTENQQIRLDVMFGDVLKQSFSDPIVLRDAMKHMFLLEKDIVFQVIDEMGIRLSPEERENIQRIPTKSIKAFMLYCSGLEMEDQGNYDQAYDFFNESLMYDPNFIMASEKAYGAQSMAMSHNYAYEWSGVRKTQRKRETEQVDVAGSLVLDRMQTVSGNIGTYYRGNVDRGTSFETDQVDTRTSFDQLSGSARSIEVITNENILSPRNLPPPPAPPRDIP